MERQQSRTRSPDGGSPDHSLLTTFTFDSYGIVFDRDVLRAAGFRFSPAESVRFRISQIYTSVGSVDSNAPIPVRLQPQTYTIAPYYQSRNAGNYHYRANERGEYPNPGPEFYDGHYYWHFLDPHRDTGCRLIESLAAYCGYSDSQAFMDSMESLLLEHPRTKKDFATSQANHIMLHFAPIERERLADYPQYNATSPKRLGYRQRLYNQIADVLSKGGYTQAEVNTYINEGVYAHAIIDGKKVTHRDGTFLLLVRELFKQHDEEYYPKFTKPEHYQVIRSEEDTQQILATAESLGFTPYHWWNASRHDSYEYWGVKLPGFENLSQDATIQQVRTVAAQLGI